MRNLGLLREIIDSLPFATLVVTSSGRVAWWNKTSEHIFGWKSSEVLGRPNPTVPTDRQDEFRAFQEIVSGGRVLRVRSVRQRKDGALIEVKATMAPMPAGSGALTNTLILLEPVVGPAYEIREHVQVPGDLLPSAEDRPEQRPLPAALSRFTPRQREIIMLVARGCRNREIAKSLSLGEQQIKNYLRGIYREINVASRAELLSWLNRQ
jgi:PAS domain S-box-containing protein